MRVVVVHNGVACECVFVSRKKYVLCQKLLCASIENQGIGVVEEVVKQGG